MRETALARMVTRGDAIFPAHILFQTVAAPVAVVEWRIGEDVVSFEVFVQVAMKAVRPVQG